MSLLKTHATIIILSVLGMLSFAYAIKLSLSISSSLKYILFFIQALFLAYLGYKFLTSLISAWNEWRWSPDRLR